MAAREAEINPGIDLAVVDDPPDKLLKTNTIDSEDAAKELTGRRSSQGSKSRRCHKYAMDHMNFDLKENEDKSS